MTQYLLTVSHAPEAYSTESQFGAYESEAEMTAAFAATGAFNQKLMDEGYWVFAGGLTPPQTATGVDGRGAEVVVTDGPFVESKEYLGGFWVIDAPDLDVAIRLAGEGSRACGQRVEVRAFQGE